MKIVLFSATDFGYMCLQKLISMNEEIVGIFTVPREFNISWSPDKPVTNVRYRDFKQISNNYDIPVVEVTKRLPDLEYIKVLKDWEPDFILVAGWYHMVQNR